DGGEDGLYFYKEITKSSIKYLKENGILVYEIGYNQGMSVKEILRENNFSNIKVLKDYQNHDRVVRGEKI
ncbi:MAG TPA: peptide chain release factor N(5)-glutamine methyltransferase, partial [Tissierellaceae bacterium]